MSAEDEWADEPTPAPAPAPAPKDDTTQDQPKDEPELFYPDLPRFVSEWLLQVYRRPLGQGRTWCPQWWEHPEAIVRLEALWRSWEHLRLDAATGMSIWLRDHADHHMSVLLDEHGPFKGCGVERGHTTRPLPPFIQEGQAPAGMFD
ncbi:DUF4913 domain-containing protein [Ornithinimicrobium sp. LYQ92]|uniref:DUF4913 domain-containing protein n=1 Tax=Serinicoccus sp. LYQ92 TaxID=3378798 RepID=UPI00385304EB